ncbi:MAG: nucleotide exchange factor GrpE [Candidatus Sericytochromatia bacterium]|nr:MAG: nucleotide exchange factor GrpE [Candidatus Sericytochromatia bacterium]
MVEKLKEEDIWKDAFEAAEEIKSSKKKKDNKKENVKETDKEEDDNKDIKNENLKTSDKEKEEDTINNGELVAKYDELEKKYQILKQEFDNKDSQLKRLAADFDNFRRRQNQEKEDLIKYAYEKLFGDLLPVLDNFERAINSSKDAKDISSIVSGVEMIQKQLLDIMSRNGLEVIKALGNSFDPNFHEAVQQIVDDEKESDTVVNELQKGYLLNGRVIRPSMVVVSKKSNE